MIRIDHLNCLYHIHKHIGMLGDRPSFTLKFSNIFTFLEKFQGIDTSLPIGLGLNIQSPKSLFTDTYLVPSCTHNLIVFKEFTLTSIIKLYEGDVLLLFN